ncbi:hypothetical protein [Noviherbaspirillum sp. UKPF54]|uniref:hypothetical protein n=1 Tax=Noviherbaspirillum sp. UKPF54 TaxID=2601898 RepID=UPI0011B1408F|nr:hypothetical protein [Noviherbaspirillum sp. UKPF54]QDZ29696.1 hypothetical protein FAY22_18040 [Noviherbaspirillum sp. UKPF54]
MTVRLWPQDACPCVFSFGCSGSHRRLPISVVEPALPTQTRQLAFSKADMAVSNFNAEMTGAFVRYNSAAKLPQYAGIAAVIDKNRKT